MNSMLLNPRFRTPPKMVTMAALISVKMMLDEEKSESIQISCDGDIQEQYSIEMAIAAFQKTNRCGPKMAYDGTATTEQFKAMLDVVAGLLKKEKGKKELVTIDLSTWKDIKSIKIMNRDQEEEANIEVDNENQKEGNTPKTPKENTNFGGDPRRGKEQFEETKVTKLVDNKKDVNEKGEDENKKKEDEDELTPM